MLLELLADYTVRPPTMDDLDAVHALITTVDFAEAGESDADNGDMRLDWEQADLTRDA